MTEDIKDTILELIDQKEKYIEQYKQRQNASISLLVKMTEELNLLINLYNSLIDLSKGLPIEKLKEISDKVKKIEELDSELSGHSILIHKNEGNNLSQIDIYI